MRRCCECKKRVWPWQQSGLSFSPIHQRCHAAVITKLIAESPSDTQEMIIEEMRRAKEAGLTI